MAVTYTVTNLSKDVAGNRRRHRGTVTCSGTTTDNGDVLAASALGLARVDQFMAASSVDSTSNPENSFTVKAASVGTSGATLVFFGGAAAGSAQAALTDGATVTNYQFDFEAIGV